MKYLEPETYPAAVQLAAELGEAMFGTGFDSSSMMQAIQGAFEQAVTVHGPDPIRMGGWYISTADLKTFEISRTQTHALNFPTWKFIPLADSETWLGAVGRACDSEGLDFDNLNGDEMLRLAGYCPGAVVAEIVAVAFLKAGIRQAVSEYFESARPQASSASL